MVPLRPLLDELLQPFARLHLARVDPLLSLKPTTVAMLEGKEE